MGAPSPCRVSMPVTRVGGESGAFKSVVPCADQPPAAGEISNSSWPTVWPSSWMVNLPLSCANTPAFCWGEARARELNVTRDTVRMPNVTFDLKRLRITKQLLQKGERLIRTTARHKVCHIREG